MDSSRLAFRVEGQRRQELQRLPRVGHGLEARSQVDQRGSLKAVPMNEIPAGTPNENLMGTLMIG